MSAVMFKSLKESIVQPRYTKAIIKEARRTPKGAETVWCVVEGESDKRIYERFFNSDTTEVRPSEDEKGHTGARNVENIVTELIEEDGCPIFGIRDCDYTEYDDSYESKVAVFLTDCRDVEMMMFDAPSVKKELENWESSFPQKIEDGKLGCRYLGYLRIFNSVYDIGFSFRKKCKIANIWDYKRHEIKKDCKHILLSEYVSNCPDEVTEERISQFITDKKLEGEPSSKICRGHDLEDLLAYMMVKREYSQNNIRQHMTISYSYEDFKTTNLCRSISQWAAGKGVKILLNN